MYSHKGRYFNYLSLNYYLLNIQYIYQYIVVIQYIIYKISKSILEL